MAEETLRRNLDIAFDPGPDFPSQLLLSRTMAMLRAEAGVGVKRRADRQLSWQWFHNRAPRGTRQAFAAALMFALLVAALGALLAIHGYVQRSTPAQTQHHASGACSHGNLHMVSATVGWNGMLRTIDGGATWQDVTPTALRGHTTGGYETCAFDGDHLWVTQIVGSTDLSEGELYLWFTRDGGSTWTESAPVPIGGITPTVQLQFSDARHGWMVTTSDVNSQVGNDVVVYATEDGGATWNQLATSAGDPNSALNQYQGCTGPTGLTFVDQRVGWMTWDCITQSFPFVTPHAPVLVTRDGGRNWQYAITPDLRTSLQSIAPDLAWSCGAAPPVFVSQNGVLPIACDGYPTHDGVAVGGSQGQLLWAGVLRTSGAAAPNLSETTDYSNGGVTWVVASLPVAVDLSKIDFVDANHGFAFAYEGASNDLYTTSDAGQHWLMTSHAVFGTDQGGTCNFKNLPDCAGTSAPPVTAFEFVDVKTGFAYPGPSTTTPWRTTDGGRTWVQPRSTP